MTHGRDRKTIHIEAATKRKENGIVTAAVWRSFVGESAPIGRDDGDDGQDQADGRQSLSQSGHSQIALLHLLILPCDGPTHTRTFLALTLFLFFVFLVRHYTWKLFRVMSLGAAQKTVVSLVGTSSKSVMYKVIQRRNQLRSSSTCNIR